MENAIIFNKVGKRFKRSRKLLLKEALIDIFKLSSTDYFWSLKDVSFKINKGETVGIIGPNGSGKSTVLKLIAQVMHPTNGTVKVKGNVAPLIELAAGFHPELTGRENIYLNGAILGIDRDSMNKKIDSIISFSELAEFVDTPVKHYSSGMYMRLGFSIAVHVDADILLIDEILAVGDHDFRKKCLERMRSFKEKGLTIILVSHDLAIVEEFCERVIYIDKGKLLSDGSPKEVISEYIHQKPFRWGDGKVEIKKTWLVNKEPVKNSGIQIKMNTEFHTDATDPVFGITIRNSSNDDVLAANTLWSKVKTGKFKKGDRITVTFRLKTALPKGRYSVSSAVAYSDLRGNYDWRSNTLFFNVVQDKTTNYIDTRINITLDHN